MIDDVDDEQVREEEPVEEHDEHSLAPEHDDHHDEVAASLVNALKQLREDADGLEAMSLDEGRVEAAEQLAEQAAALDEQIGSVARADEG